MTIEAVPAIGIHDEVEAPVRLAAVPPDAGFAKLLQRGIEAVDGRVQASHADLQGLAMGEAPNLHGVMIGLEESRLALQLMLQVRNRLLEAYQEVMRMQV